MQAEDEVRTLWDQEAESVRNPAEKGRRDVGNERGEIEDAQFELCVLPWKYNLLVEGQRLGQLNFLERRGRRRDARSAAAAGAAAARGMMMERVATTALLLPILLLPLAKALKFIFSIVLGHADLS